MIIEKPYCPCVMEPDSEDCEGQVTWDRTLLAYTCDTHRVLTVQPSLGSDVNADD
jgi:hypothetical protein